MAAALPVTTRLAPSTVEAMDRAVAAGTASSRRGLVEAAIADWLRVHDEDAIVASYQRAYATADPEHDALVGALGAFSMSQCLDADPA